MREKSKVDSSDYESSDERCNDETNEAYIDGKSLMVGISSYIANFYQSKLQESPEKDDNVTYQNKLLELNYLKCR